MKQTDEGQPNKRKAKNSFESSSFGSLLSTKLTEEVLSSIDEISLMLDFATLLAEIAFKRQFGKVFPKGGKQELSPFSEASPCLLKILLTKFSSAKIVSHFVASPRGEAVAGSD